MAKNMTSIQYRSFKCDTFCMKTHILPDEEEKDSAKQKGSTSINLATNFKQY